MAGGLMNLVAYGNQNVILNGNPSKTYFKFTYSKYTNFGLQKFRLDVQGQRILNMTQESYFTFKVPRYGDLLMDLYLVVNLPNIWSPILTPEQVTPRVTRNGIDPDPEFSQWRPYEFKWIDNLGSQLIKEVTFMVGGQMIQKFSGDYMFNLVERDFREDKKLLYYQMTGNIPELNNPSNYSNNNGYYPNAWYTSSPAGAEPSIRAKTLYIPINIWFTLASQMAFPLVALQYNQLEIKFTLRAIEDLFVVRDVTATDKYWRIPKNIPGPGYEPPGTAGDGNQFLNSLDCSQKAPYVRPRQTDLAFQFYRFIQQPPFEYLFTLDLSGGTFDTFPNKNTNWNADIHIMSTYAFLSQEEVRVFALKPQNYLIKEIFEWYEYNVVGSQRINLDSLGLVSNWMFYFQRTDVINRNQWSNYTNWAYDEKPKYLLDANPEGNFYIDYGFNTGYTLSPCCPYGPSEPASSINEAFTWLQNGDKYQANVWYENNSYGPGTHPGARYGDSNIKITGEYSDKNKKDILISAGILLDGKYRENVLQAQVFSQVEKYVRTFGFASSTGLNCYNFALHSNPFDFQPSGALNMSKFNTIQFEVQTYMPPLDASAQTLVICDASGGIIGINKPVWTIYEYTYNFKCMEERYNILKFTNGNCALAYAR
jgi:hypothetical protein